MCWAFRCDSWRRKRSLKASRTWKYVTKSHPLVITATSVLIAILGSWGTRVLRNRHHWLAPIHDGPGWQTLRQWWYAHYDTCHSISLPHIPFLGILALQTRLASVEKTARGTYVVTTEISPGSEAVSRCTFEAESIVNCAGLHADKVAEIILGENVPEYKLYPCRGHYFGYFGK